MPMSNVFLILHFYAWILISLMVMIMGLIGRFYEQKFQYKTGSSFLFVLAAILFICSFLDIIIGGNELIGLMKTLTMLTAAVLSTQLYRTMTGVER